MSTVATGIPILTSPSRFTFTPPRLPTPRVSADECDNPPHLSYSQIKRFAQCPLQWYLSRRYPPAFVPAALIFGGAYHAAMETYYQARLEGRDAALDDLVAAFDRHWAKETQAKRLPVKYTAKLEDEAGMRELASRMLTAFIQHTQPGTVVALEEAFAITLAPDLPPIMGKIDLIEIRTDDDGVRRAWLVDFKTAARKPGDGDLDQDQLLLYSLAAQQVGWVKSLGLPLALRFDVATKVKSPEILSVPITPMKRETARLVEKFRQCHRAMQAGAYYPVPGWSCGGCGHSHLCAAWPALPARSEAA